jgi:hypothetical protein
MSDGPHLGALPPILNDWGALNIQGALHRKLNCGHLIAKKPGCYARLFTYSQVN